MGDHLFHDSSKISSDRLDLILYNLEQSVARSYAIIILRYIIKRCPNKIDRSRRLVSIAFATLAPL